MSQQPHATDRPAPDTSGAGAAHRDWMMVGAGIAVLLAVLATILALVAIAESHSGGETATAAPAPAQPAADTPAVAPTLEEAGDVEFEPFERVDPNLPAVPAGDVKRFDVDVYHHVTQVSADLAPASHARGGQSFWNLKVAEMS